MIDGIFTNVTIVMTTRMSAAPTVQPISSRVLPWICAATAPRLARNFHSAQKRRPSTTTNTIAAMTRIMS